MGPDRLEKGQKTQGDLPPELFWALGLLLSCKLNLHLAQLACLGNQEIANGKDGRYLALSMLHLDIEADVNHRVRERPDSTPLFIFFSPEN